LAGDDEAEWNCPRLLAVIDGFDPRKNRGRL
jgi:hypothetical protein